MYEDELSQYIQNVLQRAPNPGEVESYQSIIDNNVASLDEVLGMIINSSEAVDNVYPVILAYQAIYGRVPDAGGLEYWTGVYESNHGLDNPNTTTVDEALVAVLKAFVNPEQTPEFISRYGANPSGDQFVAAAYQNVLNRSPDQAGLTYWQARYAQIHDQLEAKAEADAAAGDPALTAAQIDVETRAQILEQFVDSAEYKTATAEEVDAFLADRAHGEDASGSLWDFDPSARVGQTFNLTRVDDNFTGTDPNTTTGEGGNDTFNAPLSAAIDGLVAAQTLQGSDILDGKGGHDVLKAELNGTGTTANPTLSGIETLNLTSIYGLALGAGGPGVLDLSRATGVEEINDVNSQNDLDVFGVQAPADIGMNGVAGHTAFDVTYGNDVVVNIQNVTVENTGSAGTGMAWLNIDTALAVNTMNLDVSNSYVDVDADVSGLGSTLNLTVSDGVVLDLGADGAENVNISGSGPLTIDGEHDFAGLANLDAVDYNGDLNIDVSGSTGLENVATGDGNDVVTVNNLAVNGNLAIDLGGGDNNTLAINDHGGAVLSHNDINALDFTGGVSNVQTLEFHDHVGLWSDATLALDGFDVAPSTINFDSSFNGHNSDFTIANAGADLTLNATGNFETNGKVIVDGVEQLIVNSTAYAELDGSVSGDVLETLAVASGTSSDADVTLNTPDELTALKNVAVASGKDASLTINGTAGIEQILGVNQVEQITVDVTAGASFPDGFLTSARTAGGTIALNSSSLATGVLTAAYDVTLDGFIVAPPATDAGFDNGAASDIAAALATHAEFGSTDGGGVTSSGDVVTVTWDDFGPHQGLAYFASGSSANTGEGSINGVTTSVVTSGVAETPMQAGTGYEALETVSVTAVNDATADLHDVYGNFALTVNAGHDADVDLQNTKVTTVSVTAVNHADVDIGGDTIGAPSLTTVTVVANTADIHLGTGDMDVNNTGPIGNDFSAFQTLDVSRVATNVTVDTSTAHFGEGQLVTYDIGATQDGTAVTDVTFTANAVREAFDFVGSNIGEVSISDFTTGADPATGDRIDLSHFANIHSAGDLVFTDSNGAAAGGDLVITALHDSDFSGSITLVGMADYAADVSAFNIIYA
jgi:hypothetical protein